MGCAVKQVDQISNTKKNIEETTDDISFHSGVYFDEICWDETVAYLGPTIPNKETAIAVASAIFEGMEKSAETEEFLPRAVDYDEPGGIWIVSFWKENLKEETNPSVELLSYTCRIAIQESDGTVLRIWFEE